MPTSYCLKMARGVLILVVGLVALMYGCHHGIGSIIVWGAFFCFASVGAISEATKMRGRQLT